MTDDPHREELERWHCWENDDRVPGRPQMTAFRRRLRLHQSVWRERNGHPAGTVGVRYHEWAKPETPKPENRHRYLEVAERSGAFRPDVAAELMDRSPLAVMWLEHLLVLSMLQHGGDDWRWGRYVLVHPAGNSGMAEMCERYRSLLADDSTFGSITTEALLDAGALPETAAEAIRDRYLAL